MPDNFGQNEFEQAFINESWKKLELLLSDDMPVEKTKTNKWVGLLLFSQLLSLVVIGGLIYSHFSATPFTKLTKEKIVYQTVVKEIQVPYAVESEIKPYTTRPSILPNISLFKKDFFNYAQLNNAASSIAYLKSQLSEIKSFKSNNLFTSQTIKPIQLPNSGELIANSKDKNSPYSIAPLVGDRESIKDKLNFGVGIILSASNNLDYTGYGIVSTIEFPISKKVNFGTGIGFSHLSREFDVLPIFPNSYSTYNVKSSEVDLEEKSSFYQSLTDMKQIFIPFNVSYTLNTKLAFKTGFNIRYNFDQSLDTDLIYAIEKATSTLNRAEDLYFNNINLGLELGFKYTINDNFNLTMSSEFGLNSLINKNQFSTNKDPDFNPNYNPDYFLNLVNLTTTYSF